MCETVDPETARYRGDRDELSAVECKILENVLATINIPSNWVIDFVDGLWVSFSRNDALPNPENENNGAAIYIWPFEKDPGFQVSLFHEDGAPCLSCLKGDGGHWSADTFHEALCHVDNILGNADAIAAQKTNQSPSEPVNDPFIYPMREAAAETPGST